MMHIIVIVATIVWTGIAGFGLVRRRDSRPWRLAVLWSTGTFTGILAAGNAMDKDWWHVALMSALTIFILALAWKDQRNVRWLEKDFY